MATVNNNGYALTFASKRLKSDKDVALKAFFSEGKSPTGISMVYDIIKLINPTLRNNHDFIIDVMKIQPTDFRWTSVLTKKIFADRSFMDRAVKIGGLNILQLASRELKGDKDFVMSAFESYNPDSKIKYGYNENILSLMSPSLREDIDVLSMAIKIDASCAKKGSKSSPKPPQLFD